MATPMKLHLIKILPISIITIVFFTTCKKYPENTLWFKNPKRICPVDGYITSYKVNGIDSLDLLNLYYNPNRDSYFSYNNGITSVREEPMQAVYKGNSIFYINDLNSMRIADGKLTWNTDKKHIKMEFKRSGDDTMYFKKNIFIESEHTWEVLYLDKNKKAKIKTTFNNGNTYEITFN